MALMNQGFEDEDGTGFLSLEIEGNFLQIAIEDPDEEESPYVSIGLSQVVNLIEYLLKSRRLLSARSSAENMWVLNKLNDLMEIF